MASVATEDQRSVESKEDDKEFIPPPQDWFNLDEKESEEEPEGCHPDANQGTCVIHQEIPSCSDSPKSNSPTRQLKKRSRKQTVGAPLPSPSWNEISCEVLPKAAMELLSSSVLRVCYLSRKSYAHVQWQHGYSDLGNIGGYFTPSESLQGDEYQRFSSLSWLDRQLVKEWRTYTPNETDGGDDQSANDNEDDAEFLRARTLVPAPMQRPSWRRAETCNICSAVFGPTRLRHHCRQCGNSYCQSHSSMTHPLPHLGYLPTVPERVCDECKRMLLTQDLAERVAWRQARARDFLQGHLIPYFETGVDTMEQALLRVTKAALQMAKTIPLGAQATVAVETVDVLRKHGLNGIYTIMLRQEFLAAADLLRKALGINRTAWPLSVHELSAAIFYAIAQHRALRGINPEKEEWDHRVTTSDEEVPLPHKNNLPERVPSTTPSFSDIDGDAVCKHVSDDTLSSLIFYAPIALNFIYVEKQVDMQLLAAQQGWRLVYAHLEQEVGFKDCDRPASALFVHEAQKVACLAIRGTATIHDIVTDIRQIPVPFPNEIEQATEQGWTTVSRGQGLAVSGMAGAAANLFREHIDSLLSFAKEGFRIRLTGHSLGGSVAAMLGVLLLPCLESLELEDAISLRVYTYGSASCVDTNLAKFMESFVVSVVHHDDVVPRLTPISCRDLLKHLLHIRETWVKEHFENDLRAVTERARTAWAPRWRTGFALSRPSGSMRMMYYPSQASFKKYYLRTSRKLRELQEKLMGPVSVSRTDENSQSDDGDRLDGPGIRSTPDEVFDGEIAAKCLDSDVFYRSESERSNQENAEVDLEWEEPRMLVDVLGGVANSAEGLIVDGDEFFDSEEQLIDTEEASAVSDMFDNAIDESFDRNPANHMGEGSDVEAVDLYDDSDADIESVDSTPSSVYQPDNNAAVTTTDEMNGVTLEEADQIGAVVLQDTPLPRMYLPGKIVHVYSHRGVYKAAYVPCAFREIRRISLAGNMLSDHKSDAYFHGLLEVRTVRIASERAPRWTAFDEDTTW